ncbi:hypothetical protein GYMLUDRAFT_63653 [Collybiopsis luxurians FD-317 M1]|uniref:DDE Tnp4 domain-containing protein n=1 Tax=Collybiopsis luxurians FD-317 M1 TaxID=944289 RepID=A0A0D0CEV5_9AGAR|nr:hypothetical protein GYMLUDRAFT_63653 [Collybiopsis luxurians FD-317 M1]
MYSSCYEASHKSKEKLPPQLLFLLYQTKHSNPEAFQQDLCITPYTFDQHVQQIEHDNIFSNQSQNSQMSVEEQLAIMLYQFGHYGNGVSLPGVACWAGIGKGSVLLVTKRVMVALLQPHMLQAMCGCQLKKKRREQRVRLKSIHALDGIMDCTWLMSLNFQIISLPNLHIVDVGYGFTGSTHDASAWEKTHMKQQYKKLLRPGEWVWVDSAYPVSDWVVAPYKWPEQELPDNESEHAISFLKGHFQSLKDLHINIVNEKSHKFATYWGLSCIVVHNFAMDCEEQEQSFCGDTSDDPIMQDPFLKEGLEAEEDDDNFMATEVTVQNSWQHLSAGRQK